MKVTLLSGFLGAGKTTLLKRILRHNNNNNNDRSDDDKKKKKKKLQMAVIVNDMGDINLDASEIKNSKVVQEGAEMVELHDGCICCTLRGDLLRTVKSLSEENKYDYLVIESTGIGEPLPVAQTFTMNVMEDEIMMEQGGDDDYLKKDHDDDDNNKKSLSQYATLDTLVTVVDALNIYDVLSSIETLADENNISGMLGNTGASSSSVEEEEKKEMDHDVDHTNSFHETNDNAEYNNEGEIQQQQQQQEEEYEDDRPVSQLWLDQIEFANVIVVSKAPLFLEQQHSNAEAKLNEMKKFLQKLNPKAKIIIPREMQYGDLDVSKELINTGLFDRKEAESSDAWLEEWNKEEHNPETEEYNITSMSFTCDTMPFHPERLCDIFTGFGDYHSAIRNTTSTTKEEEENTTNEKKVHNTNDSIFQGVFRTKGHLWLANANAFPLVFSTAGKHIQMGVTEQQTPFLAATNPEYWEEEEHHTCQQMKKDGTWTNKYGDRKSQLIFIGVGLDKKLIKEKLTEALLTEEESVALGGMKGWKTLSDPFFDGAVYEHFELPEPYGAPYNDDDE